MDSLTQIALGAAVGTAVLGRKVGPRAALWGAVCGTLPDLDVLLPYGDPVRDFTFHRAESHSIFSADSRLTGARALDPPAAPARWGDLLANGWRSSGWPWSRTRCSTR